MLVRHGHECLSFTYSHQLSESRNHDFCYKFYMGHNRALPGCTVIQLSWSSSAPASLLSKTLRSAAFPWDVGNKPHSYSAWRVLCAPSISTRTSRITGLFPRGRGTAGREQMWMEIALAQRNDHWCFILLLLWVQPSSSLTSRLSQPRLLVSFPSSLWEQEDNKSSTWDHGLSPKNISLQPRSWSTLGHQLVTLQTSTLSSPARSMAKAKGSHYSCRDLASSAVSREKPHWQSLCCAQKSF